MSDWTNLFAALALGGERFVEWLLSMTAWTAAIVVVALVADRALAFRVRATYRLALYAAVPLRLLLPIRWTTPFGALSGNAAHGAAGGVGLGDVLFGPLHGPLEVSWRALVLPFYAAICVVLMVRWARGHARLAREAASARPARAAIAAFAPGEPVYEHETLGPMVVGVVRPRILIARPLAESLAPGALAWALRHERCHVARRDPLLAAVISLFALLAWPIIPVWVAAARMRHLIELACDEAALDGVGDADRKSYGRALLAVSEWEPITVRRAALNFGAPLAMRIAALRVRPRWPRAVQVAIALAAVGLLVACAGRRPGAQTPLAAPEKLEASTTTPSSGRVDVPPRGASSETTPATPDPTGATGAVEALRPKFRECYNEGLKSDATMEGAVQLAVQLAPTGTVSSVLSESSTGLSEGVVDCMADAVRGATFEPPGGSGARLVIPVAFRQRR
jgi:hypothetical protein